MAGRGPAPKDPDARRRRNKDAAFDELPAEGYRGAYPRLPASWRTEQELTTRGKDGQERTRVRVVRVRYLAATRAWYEDWARSPMAAWFTAIDWRRLQRIAPLVDQYERRPTKELAAELRLQETLLGGTLMDRQRMRLRVTRREDTPAGGQRPMAQVRRLRAVDPGAIAHEPS